MTVIYPEDAVRYALKLLGLSKDHLLEKMRSNFDSYNDFLEYIK